MNSLFFSWKQFFFALKIIYFNWRIITLQYCDSFGNTSTWISQTCAPQSWTPSLSLPNLSLWVVPEHRLWVPFFTRRTCTHHLFSCGNVYVSVLLLMFLFKVLTPFPLTPFSVFPSSSLSSETWLAYFIIMFLCSLEGGCHNGWGFELGSFWHQWCINTWYVVY